MKKTRAALISVLLFWPISGHTLSPKVGIENTMGGKKYSYDVMLEGKKKNDAFGMSVSNAGDVNGDGYDDVIVGAPGGALSTEDLENNTVYIYFGSPTGIIKTNPRKLLGESNEPDRFGYSVSAAGDVNGDGYDDVIVGAYQHSNSDTGSYIGAVYVYYGFPSNSKKSGSVGQIVSEGVNPDWIKEGEKETDLFGVSVSAAGDVNGDGYDDVIIGAMGFRSFDVDSDKIEAHPGEYKDKEQNGKAYVYYGSAKGLSNKPAWTSTGEKNYRFGNYVSTAGDVNGDGYDDVIVGTVSGEVYLYYGSKWGLGAHLTSNTPLSFSKDIFPDSSFFEEAVWYAEGENKSDKFGFALKCAGDINGDGYDDVIIGAYRYNEEKNKTGIGVNNRYDIKKGKVYVFYGSASGLSSTPDWSVTGENKRDLFGYSVSTAGDMNGDGYDDVVIGAIDYDIVLNNNLGTETLQNAGKAYVYYGSLTGLDLEPGLEITGSNQKNNEFGSPVSSAGDTNGDGYDDIIVGGRGYDKTRGAAYIFQGRKVTSSKVSDEHGISSSSIISLGSLTIKSNFGYSVAVCHLNDDIYDDVVVGAPGYSDTTYDDEGAIFVFYGSDTGPSTSYTVRKGGEDYRNMGYAVACADTNGDEYDDVIVGVPGYGMTVAIPAGQIRIYKGSPSGISSSYTYINGPKNSPTNYETGFGKSVANVGDVNGDGIEDILVGAPNFDTSSQTDTGLVYLYYGSSSGIVTGATEDWQENFYSTGYALGGSIAGAGDINGDGFLDILMGAPENSTKGVVHVYLGSSGGFGSSNWSISGSTTSLFGTSLGHADINGDGYSDVLVGDEGYDDAETDQGKVRVYYGSSSGLTPATDFDTLSFIRQEGAYLGSSVIGIGDYDGDGYEDFAMGSYGYDGDYTDEGLIAITRGSSSGISKGYLTTTVTLTGGRTEAGLGWAMATGDTDGDGLIEVIVGMPNYDFDETTSYNDEVGSFGVIELE